ncbi:MAG: D-Ala-D-Ala carboxypeptidase family metallohydrolase [Cyanobacteriota bacterium]
MTQAIAPFIPLSAPPAESPATQPPAQDEQKERFKAYLRVKIGTLEFNSLQGDILGNPYIRLSTYQFSSARIVINDPEDRLRGEIEKQEAVEIEVGYVGGYRQNVLMGKLYRVGRVPPDGTEIEVIDNSATLQSTGSAVQVAAEKPALSPVVLERIAELKRGQAADAPNNASDGATGAIAPVTTMPQESTPPASGFAALANLRKQASAAATGNSNPVPPAEQVAAQDQLLKFRNNSSAGISAAGSVRLTQGGMQSAQQNALLQGDVVVARGNTVEQVSPGNAQPSGVVLNFAQNPSLAIARPRITKKTPLQLQSAFGSITVVGWNPVDKTTVGATVVTPGEPPQHPTGNIDVPEWGAIKLSDPIYPGCVYTWGDATKNGSRVPASRSVMEGIARIARVMQGLCDRYNSGRKIRINSWYRDPESNRRAGGATRSRHLQGDAVDFSHPNMAQIHQDLVNSWNGGVAIKPGSFVHIDTGSKRRWRY